MFSISEASSFYNRGETELDFDKRTVFGYDDCVMVWGSTAEGWLKYIDKHPYIAGAFIWTGFDYTGEPTPHILNSVTSFGVIDLCGYAKDVYYYYKSWWRGEDELYLFPHWNHKKGETVRVAVNSNLEEIELFLNGKSLGRKKMERLGHLEWQVPFEEGKIEAVGYRGGKEVKLDSPAFIENDRTYTPIRFIAEELGATVEWIEAKQKVVITK